MNSHQRRKSRRYWKYQIEFKVTDDVNVEDIKQWCKDNIGKKYVVWGFDNSFWYQGEDQLFYFNKDKDAVKFTLKWS